MLTLTYQLKQMEDLDPSDTWFDAISSNFEQLDAHDHDGVTSAPLSFLAGTVETQAISSVAWVLVSGGRYRQLVTLPSIGSVPLEYDDVVMEVRDSAGTRVYPGIEKVSDTTFYLYTTDNTADYSVIYSR